MPFFEVVLLGAIAGFSIFLGLPLGRVGQLEVKTKAFLNAVAIGVLIFLLIDVVGHAQAPVEDALVAASQDHTGTWWRFSWLLALFIGGLALGMLSLVAYDRHMAAKRRSATNVALGRSVGAAALSDLDTLDGDLVLAPSFRHGAGHVALMIAVGIGLHNFAEGLAIGQSAASNEISLAVLLIVGFGLHNATEGFGIVAPFANESEPPSWKFLFVLGIIGGGPTLLGTIVGQAVVSDALFVGFLALAAGSILYVVVQLLQVATKLGYKDQLMAGLLVGLLAGVLTDFILVAAGA